MREQLKLLEALQAIDLRLQEFEGELSALPTKLQAMKEDVRRVETLLEQDKARLAEAEAYNTELADAVARDRDQLNKTKVKLAAVRTSKEYMAIQREFESGRKLTSDREDEIAKLELALKETQTGVGDKEGQLAELQSHVSAEARETEARLVELEAQAKELRIERDKHCAVVPKPLFRKYDRIRRLRNGTAVVAAENGVCTGCRMHLPPQLYNILQRGETIEQCPNCQRIVYFEAPPPSEDEA